MTICRINNQDELLYGKKLVAHLNVVTISKSALQNLLSCLARCHLNISGILPSAYASGLSCLSYEEKHSSIFPYLHCNNNVSRIRFLGNRNISIWGFRSFMYNIPVHIFIWLYI